MNLQAAKAQFERGIAAFGAGDFVLAAAAFESALAQAPGRPSLLINLAATRLELGQPGQALPLLQQAIEATPGDTQAWAHQARALVALGRPAEALAACNRALALRPAATLAAGLHYQRALAQGLLGDEVAALADAQAAVALAPAHGAAWRLIGSLERDAGRIEAARAALQQAAAHGADDELTAYLRAAVGSAPMPPRPPRAYVQQLFDAYADDFDDHLTAGLGYEAPARLVALLQAHGALKADTQALDLGCGTGAFAPLLQGKIAALDGIDLSPRMCEAAARRGGYRQLGCADLAEHLAATQRRYGLVLAADVFIYVGVLDAVFAGLQRVLQPGGVLACSIEWLPDDAASPQLRSSARYAHSIADLRGLGERCGLHLRCAERDVLRTEQGLPIDGAYVLMAAG